MTRATILPGLVALLLILSSGCKSKEPLLRTVPVKETTRVELRTIKLPGDTILVRVPVEGLSDTVRSSGASVSPEGLQLLWELRNGLLELKAQNPPRKIATPVTTITREVPVEVVREVEVNRLHRWQKALMTLGALLALSLCYRAYQWLKKLQPF